VAEVAAFVDDVEELAQLLPEYRRLTTSWQALRSRPSSATEVDTRALRRPALKRFRVAVCVCK